MSYTNLPTTTENVNNRLPEIGIQSVVDEIIEGLSQQQKKISPKFFYDKIGSELFEHITQLPEYYLTRSEKEILSTIVPKLNIDWKNLNIIELGSGDPSKIRILLQQISPKKELSYYPIDISNSALVASVKAIQEEFHLQRVQGIIADFTRLPKEFVPYGNNLFCFFGSTLGNFEQSDMIDFLKNIKSVMKKSDYLLLGLDLEKDKQTLEAAYNDSQGITKAFNLNILKHINLLAETNFEASNFKHWAYYNEQKNRIEMHLVCKNYTEITIGDQVISFLKDETIHTENSHKFSHQMIYEILSEVGMKIESYHTDQNKLFCEILLKIKE